MKEVLVIEKLVPLEIQVKDEKLVLPLKPTKENLPTIIQELSKLRPQPGTFVEEVEVKADEEKESKDDSGEKDD